MRILANIVTAMKYESSFLSGKADLSKEVGKARFVLSGKIRSMGVQAFLNEE